MLSMTNLLPHAAAAALACIVTGCATQRADTPALSAPTESARPAASIDETHDLDPASAAARAVLVSPRVRAAALRLEASARRARSADSPPDPSLAISLGVPIDGLGGFPISATLMEGIGWLLNHDAIRDAADRERELAARELLATTVAVAADARRLVRTLDAAREAMAARACTAHAQRERLDAARAAADLREAAPARVRTLEIAANHADELLLAAQSDARETERALASLLAIDRIGAITRDQPQVPPTEGLTTLEIARARGRVARTSAMLSVADTPLGADARAGVGYARDIEDRQSVAGSIEFGLPIFRRGHELAALRAELAADEADLREAERLAWLDAERFHTRADTARAQLELATQSARAAQHVRETAERALAEGEASRTEVADARAAEGEARARAAERRVELAEALANLESRLADTDTSTTAPASPKETTR